MEKLCRSVTTLYRLPRISHLNLRLHPTFNATTNAASYNQSYAPSFNQLTVRHYNSQKPPSGLTGAKIFGSKNQDDGNDQPANIADILEREIQDESNELSQHLSSDQFPGFSVETDDAEVKLTKQIGDATVLVRFSVSSSLSEWPVEPQDPEQPNQDPESAQFNTTLVSMPEFQVQISRSNRTLELSCFFDEMEHDEESGEPYAVDPVFSIDELVIYEGGPKESEFAVSAEYFQEDLQAALLQYLAEHGIDDEFAKNLVAFATSYEKKQYIGLMKRLKSFVTK